MMRSSVRIRVGAFLFSFFDSFLIVSYIFRTLMSIDRNSLNGCLRCWLSLFLLFLFPSSTQLHGHLIRTLLPASAVVSYCDVKFPLRRAKKETLQARYNHGVRSRHVFVRMMSGGYVDKAVALWKPIDHKATDSTKPLTPPSREFRLNREAIRAPDAAAWGAVEPFESTAFPFACPLVRPSDQSIRPRLTGIALLSLVLEVSWWWD